MNGRIMGVQTIFYVLHYHTLDIMSANIDLARILFYASAQIYVSTYLSLAYQ